MTAGIDDTATIDIPASRRRLMALSIFGLFCLAGGLLNLSPLFSGQATWNTWAWIFLGFCLLFLLWALTAGLVALRQPKIAYRLNPRGLFIGGGDQPAFTWDQVAGATLNRGKRRSSVTVILRQGETLNAAGLMHPWVASFLGRPCEPDLSLTNMDTALDLGTFLDLISPYFHTYGTTEIKET